MDACHISPAGTMDNGAVKLQLMSDLHLEVHPQFAPLPAPGADLLVLAGDIGSYQPGSLLTDSDFGLARFSPRNGWPVPVLFVPGNHEYDNLDFDATHERLRATCERLGITWLEREALVLDGVRFIGTTLWTDFDALAPADGDLTRVLRARAKAFRAANFYLQKTGATRRDQPFQASARNGWSASSGCAMRWRSRSTAPPWWSPTSHPPCAALTRVTA
jgi:hypothetical protein